MKYFLLFLLITISTQSRSQSYSAVIPDSTITRLMQSIISGDSSTIQSELYLPETLFPENTAKNKAVWKGLVERFGLDSIFNNSDLDFFVEQSEKAIIPNTWHLDVGHFVSTESVYKVPSLTNRYYSYALPLFSRDMKLALLKYAFTAGPTKGGIGYYLCVLQTDSSWKLRYVGGWGE